MKPFPWRCGTCRNRTAVQVIIPDHAATLHHDGRQYTIRVENFCVVQCSVCNTIILDESANRTLTNKLREVAGLLTPEEIRRQRERLNLRQKEVAHSLQVSESTFSRWETDSQIQQRVMDRFLRCYYSFRQVRDYLKYLNSSGHLTTRLMENIPNHIFTEQAVFIQTINSNDHHSKNARPSGDVSSRRFAA